MTFSRFFFVFFHLLSRMYYVGVRPGSTICDVDVILCTLHERHTCSMCTRNKAAQHVYVQDNTDALEIRLKSEPSFIRVSYYL